MYKEHIWKIFSISSSLEGPPNAILSHAKFRINCFVLLWQFNNFASINAGSSQHIAERSYYTMLCRIRCRLPCTTTKMRNLCHFLDILHAILPCLVDINRSYHKTAGKVAQYHTIKKQYAAENFTLAFTSVHWQFMAVLAELFSIYQKKNGQELSILYGSLYKNLRQLGNTCTNFVHIISHFKFLKHTVSLLVSCFGPLCSILFLISKNFKLQIRK